MERHRGWWLAAVVSIAWLGMGGPVVAEEAAQSKPAETKAAEMPAAAPTSAAAPSAPAATPAPPAVRPILIKFSGEIVQINRQAAGAPMLTVRDRYGVTKEMMADPAAAKILRGAAPATLDDLKQGDQVAVDYTYDVATGKRHVQAITIAEAAATTP